MRTYESVLWNSFYDHFEHTDISFIQMYVPVFKYSQLSIQLFSMLKSYTALICMVAAKLIAQLIAI